VKKLLVVASSLDLRAPLSSTPSWWQLLKAIAEHRPLLFFGLPGLFVLLAGLALGLQVVRIYDATQQLAIGYSLITVLLVIVGLLATFVGVMLHAIRDIVREALRERPRSA